MAIKDRLNKRLTNPGIGPVQATEDTRAAKKATKIARRVVNVDADAMRHLDDWARSTGSWNISTVLEALASFKGSELEGLVEPLLLRAASIADKRKAAGNRKRAKVALRSMGEQPDRSSNS